MSDYLRFANGQTVEPSIMLDADDPFADIVDSELYDQLPLQPVARGNPQPPRFTRNHVAFRPAFFGRPFPPPAVAVPVGVPMFGRQPERLTRNIAARCRAHEMPALAFRPGATLPTIPPRGPNGVATLRFSYSDRATVTYTFATDVLRSRNGLETRTALIGCPREIYAFASVLSDAEIETLESLMAVSGSQGAIFQLALEFESLIVSADPGGSLSMTTANTDYSDWMYAGARAVFIGPDDTIISGNGSTSYAVQSFSTTNIVFNVGLDARIKAGWRVMPSIPVYLSAEESFEQNINNAGTINFTATAIIFGNATSDWAPRGATVTTHTNSATGVTWPVWDRRITVDETIPRSTMMGTELIDRGAALAIYAAWEFADFGRIVALDIQDSADRQFVKAFIGATAGQQKTFLLPTWKPDLTLSSGDASSGTIIVNGPLLGGIDYLSYFANSTAHRGLQFVTSTGTFYTDAFDCADNGDGTTTILLNQSITGVVSLISFLEVVRFDSDSFPIDWPDVSGVFSVSARVVQR